MYMPSAVTIMPGTIAAKRPRRSAILPVSGRATIDEIATAVKYRPGFVTPREVPSSGMKLNAAPVPTITEYWASDGATTPGWRRNPTPIGVALSGPVSCCRPSDRSAATTVARPAIA